MHSATRGEPHPAPAVVLGDLTLVRPLALADIPSVIVTSDPRDPALRSRHAWRGLVVPPWSGPTEAYALKALRRAGDAIVAQYGRRPLLIYGSDETLRFAHRHRAALDGSFALLLSDDRLVEDALDKQRFSLLASARAVLAPRTLRDDEPLEAAWQLGDEVILKPRRKDHVTPGLRSLLGDAKATVVPTSRLVDDPALAAERPAFVVQERLRCEPRDLLSFHGFVDPAGRLLASFVGRKVRTYPTTGGDSACIELVDDRRVAEEGGRIVERLGVRGPFKLDLLREQGTGRLVTLEVNLRYNLWHYLGAVNGVNLPLVAYRHLVSGVPSTRMVAERRVRWVDVDRDLKASREGGVATLAWLWSLARAPNVYELFAWDDPAPALRWFGDSLGRKLRAWRASA
jgi:D-aspartate ligase